MTHAIVQSAPRQKPKVQNLQPHRTFCNSLKVNLVKATINQKRKNGMYSITCTLPHPTGERCLIQREKLSFPMIGAHQTLKAVWPRFQSALIPPISSCPATRNNVVEDSNMCGCVCAYAGIQLGILPLGEDTDSWTPDNALAPLLKVLLVSLTCGMPNCFADNFIRIHIADV